MGDGIKRRTTNWAQGVSTDIKEMCLAKKPSRSKKKKVKLASERINQVQESKPSPPTLRRLDQKTIFEGVGLSLPEPGEPGITIAM